MINCFGLGHAAKLCALAHRSTAMRLDAYVDPFQTLTFRAPVTIGNPVHVQVEGIGIIPERLRTRHAGTRHVDEEIVFDGEALVEVPSAASSLPDTRDEPQTAADSQVRNPSRPEG